MEEDFYSLIERVINEVRELAESASGGRRSGINPELLHALGTDLNKLILQGEHLQQIRDLNIETIRVQEEERKRIAREIHDGPAQSFASFVRQIEFCERLLAGELNDDTRRKVTEELDHLKQQMRRGLQDLRKFIFDLRPPALEHLGLIAALRQYVQTVCENNPAKGVIRVVEEHLGEFSVPVQITVFRIVQEAINNVVKHAQAENFVLALETNNENTLVVTIEDDGVGITSPQEQRELLQQRKLGLVSMQERAQLVGGRVDFEPHEPQGTRVCLKIPLLRA